MSVLSGWTREQKHVVLASFLGWALDAFDFFLLVFVLKDIAKEFGTDVTVVTVAILLTLAMRPIGAFLFGRAADRYGRRPILMVNVALYSLLAFASGFAPSLTALLVLRALFGVAMGGEWGVASSLTMELIPPHARRFVSGLLQAGYPTGYSARLGRLRTAVSARGLARDDHDSACCWRCWSALHPHRACRNPRPGRAGPRTKAAPLPCSRSIGGSPSTRSL